MLAQVRLARAIGGEFLRRKFRSAVLIISSVALPSLAVGIFLVTLNAWWWFLLVCVIILDLFLVITLAAAGFIVKVVRPDLNKQQNVGVKAFVDKLEEVVDAIGTPLPFVIFFVSRDMILKRNPSFLQKISANSKSLQPDLAKLQKLFD